MRTPIIAGILSLLFGMASSEATAQDYLSDMAEWTFQKTCSPPVPAHESKPVSEPDASASDDTIVVTGTRVQHIDDTDLNGFIIHDPHLTLPPIHNLNTYALDMALTDALSGDKSDLTTLLDELDAVRYLINQDYECFRRITGSPRLTMFTRAQLEPFRRASLVAYADAVLIYEDQALADRARHSWYAYNRLIAADPAGVMDLLNPDDAEGHDPHWTPAQQFLEAIGGDFLSSSSTPDPLVVSAFTDEANEPWTYAASELMLADLLCGAAGYALTNETGLECQLVTYEDHAQYFEVANPALPEDYHGPKSYDLAPPVTDWAELKSIYSEARSKWTASQRERFGEGSGWYCVNLPDLGPCAAQ